MRLTVLGKDPRPYKSNYTVVKCVCGVEKSVKTTDLNRGKLKSCGCLLAEIRAKGANREAKNRNARAWNNQIKLECLTHYGPCRMLQCSAIDCIVNDVDMLTLDHTNNDGAKDRREGRNCTGVRLYWVLKKEGYPEGFSTLCCNHQSKKEMMRRRELAHLKETQNV